jgi:histidine triad (HIT) family protein
MIAVWEVRMPTIFESIVSGDIPCHRIWEDDDHLAFLDINPRIEGHTLVIPKKPWFEVFAMDEEPYIALWSAAQIVARHLQERTGCARVVIVVLGYEVEHVHIHLLPTNHLEDFPFPPVDQAALAGLEETAQKLRA